MHHWHGPTAHSYPFQCTGAKAKDNAPPLLPYTDHAGWGLGGARGLYAALAAGLEMPATTVVAKVPLQRKDGCVDVFVLPVWEVLLQSAVHSSGATRYSSTPAEVSRESSCSGLRCRQSGNALIGDNAEPHHGAQGTRFVARGSAGGERRQAAACCPHGRGSHTLGPNLKHRSSLVVTVGE